MKPLRRLSAALIVTAGLLGLAGEARAAVKYWIGAAGNVSDNTRWSTTSGGANNATAPGSADVATFDGGGTNNCTLDATVNVAGIDRQIVRDVPGATVSLRVSR